MPANLRRGTLARPVILRSSITGSATKDLSVELHGEILRATSRKAR